MNVGDVTVMNILNETGCVDLRECLVQQGGEPQLHLPEEMLPPFLLKAYQASGQVTSGDKVEDWLTPDDLAWVEQACSQGDPALPIIYLTLALTTQRFGRLKSASQWYERLLTLQEHALIYDELIHLYRQLMLYGQACQAFERKLAFLGRDPQGDPAYPGLLLQTGQVERTLALLEQPVAAGTVDPATGSMYLLAQLYDVDATTAQVQAARQHWGRSHTATVSPRQTHHRDRDPDRRLRIGILSSDLRRHSVSYTFEPLLEHCDPQQWECVAYANGLETDEVSGRMLDRFDRYHAIAHLTDAEVADRIEADRIDILIALAGHTAGHRLGVLAYKPAPIQVDWGALATLGLEQVDYRVTDAIQDPPVSQRYYREQLVYLADGCVCYRPEDSAPDVGALPMHRHGAVTFGSFNNLAKINDRLVALWSQIMRAVPDSRLLLKFPGSGDPLLAATVRKRFQDVGIEAERVGVVRYCHTWTDHLACYQQVDIALDAYPFNGGVTTLESLFMGVPVVSRYGDRCPSRMGLYYLSHVGLESLAAESEIDYVKRAVALATHPDLLERLRSSLRARLLSSPLCDGQRYARQWQEVTRRMWQQWLDKGDQ